MVCSNTCVCSRAAWRPPVPLGSVLSGCPAPSCAARNAGSRAAGGEALGACRRRRATSSSAWARAATSRSAARPSSRPSPTCAPRPSASPAGASVVRMIGHALRAKQAGVFRRGRMSSCPATALTSGLLRRWEVRRARASSSPRALALVACLAVLSASWPGTSLGQPKSTPAVKDVHRHSGPVRSVSQPACLARRCGTRVRVDERAAAWMRSCCTAVQTRKENWGKGVPTPLPQFSFLVCTAVQQLRIHARGRRRVISDSRFAACAARARWWRRERARPGCWARRCRPA